MKKYKKFLTIIVSCLFIISIFIIPGCSNKDSVSLTSVELKSSDGSNNTYQIEFSDGTTYQIQASNGKDGESVTVADLFEEYKRLYGDDIEYKDFLALYFNTQVKNTTQVASQCLLSSAIVYSEFYETSYNFWSNEESKTTNGAAGSAVIWEIGEEYTYFITHSHVVYDSNADSNNGGKLARKIHVCLYGSEASVEKSTTEFDENGYPKYIFGDSAIECELVGVSFSNDIAILKASTSRVKSINNQVRAVIVADEYYVGETAIAIGNSEGLGLSVTEGIISVDSENISLTIDQARTMREIRIDSALYHGNSGGGLFNANGELIGINNAGHTTDQNINYALPIDSVKTTINNILHYCDNTSLQQGKKILVGITVGAKSSKYVLDETTMKGRIEEEILISDVIADSIGYKIGLKKDDIITDFIINGETHTVLRNFNIGDLIKTLRVNDTISFKVKRVEDGETKTQQSATYTISESDLIVLE